MAKGTVRLDRIDLKILGVLQTDARITNQALSDKVGLSPSPCLQRVKRLEQEGLITGYLGQIDLGRLARTISVIATVTLASHSQDDFDAFEAAVADVPELVDCFKVSGQFDYFMRFVCPDITTYEQISDGLVRNGPEGIRVSSHVVLRVTKQFDGYPVEQLVTFDC